MLDFLLRIPMVGWILITLAVIILTILLVKKFEISEINLFQYIKLKPRSKPLDQKSDDGNIGNHPVVATFQVISSVSTEKVDEESLINAEKKYLHQLKLQIQQVYQNREVIKLSGDVILPNPDEISVETILHTHRKKLNLLMYPTGSIQEPENISVLDAVDKYEQLIILGAPGCGKSWTLGDIAIEQIKKYETGESRVLPLLLSASEWQENQETLDFFKTGLEKIFGKEWLDEKRILLSRFESDLSSGRFVILIDALNEMPQRKISNSLSGLDKLTRTRYSKEESKSFRTSYRGVLGDEREWKLNELAESTYLTRYVITCRTLDFEPKTLPWPQSHISPLNNEQISEFINSRLQGLDTAAQEMLDELKGNRVAQNLGNNPFYLEILTAVFSKKRELPRRRAELLEELVNWRLYETLKANTPASQIDLKIQNCTRALSSLALRMLRVGYAGSKAPIGIIQNNEKDLIEQAKKSGLISISDTRSSQSISFYHELIQEYFAALGLFNKFMKIPIRKYIRDQRWVEVISLWYEIESAKESKKSSKRRSNKILRQILASLNQKAGLSGRPTMPCLITSLTLLIAPSLPCVFALYVNELITQPGRLISAISSNPLGVILLGIIFPLLVSILWRAWSLDGIAQKNATHIASQLTHPDTAPVIVEKLIKIINRNTFQKNQVFLPALVALGDFSKGGLRSLLYSNKLDSRRLAAIALARIGDTAESQQISHILFDQSIIAIKESAKSLDNMDKLSWIKLLKNIKNFARDFIKSWFSVVTNLTLVLSTSNPEVGASLLPHLLKRWKSAENELEKIAVLSAIGGIKGTFPTDLAFDIFNDASKDDQIMPLVCMVLVKTENKEAQQAALNYLNSHEIDNPQIMPNIVLQFSQANLDSTLVLENLNSPHPALRSMFIKKAAEYSLDSVAPKLVEMLKDDNIEIQIESIKALGRLSSNLSQQSLREIVKTSISFDSTKDTQRLQEAIYALSKSGDFDSVKEIWDQIKILLPIQGDEEVTNQNKKKILSTVIECLGKYNDTRALYLLESILSKSADLSVLSKAIESISEIKLVNSIDVLRKIPYHKDVDLRKAIIDALKKLSTVSRRNVTHALQSFYSDDSESVKRHAIFTTTQISPSLHPESIVSLSSLSNENTLRHYLMRYTGLGIFESLIKEFSSTYKNSQSSKSVSTKIQVKSINPAFDQRATQERMHVFNDLYTNTSGLQRWGCMITVLWLPFFLTMLGVFFSFSVPKTIAIWLFERPLIGLGVLLSVPIIALLIESLQKFASMWLLPVLFGGIWGWRTAILITTSDTWKEKWWQLLITALLYYLILWALSRKNKFLNLSQSTKRILWAIPLMPIVANWLLFRHVVEYAQKKFKESYWHPIYFGVLTGVLTWIVFEFFGIRNLVPEWSNWLVIIFITAIITISPLEKNRYINILLTMFLGFLVFPGLVATWILNLVVLYNSETLPNGRTKALASWLSILIAPYIYIWLWKTLNIPSGILTAPYIGFWGLTIGLLAGTALRILNRGFLSHILFAPIYLALFPLLIPFFLIWGLLSIKIIRNLNLPRLFLITGVLAGMIYGIDITRRLLSLTPNSLIVLATLFLFWVFGLILAIDAYRKEKEESIATLIALSIPLLLPLIPFLTTFITVLIFVALTGLLFYMASTEKKSPKT